MKKLIVAMVCAVTLSVNAECCHRDGILTQAFGFAFDCLDYTLSLLIGHHHCCDPHCRHCSHEKYLFVDGHYEWTTDMWGHPVKTWIGPTWKRIH